MAENWTEGGRTALAAADGSMDADAPVGGGQSAADVRSLDLARYLPCSNVSTFWLMELAVAKTLVPACCRI